MQVRALIIMDMRRKIWTFPSFILQVSIAIPGDYMPQETMYAFKLLC